MRRLVLGGNKLTMVKNDVWFDIIPARLKKEDNYSVLSSNLNTMVDFL